MTTLRTRIITEARSWIGTPYHHQASVRGVGCDCLGLLRGVWRAVAGAEPEVPPPYAPDWGEARGEETLYAAAARHLDEIPPAAIAPGDVLLFRMSRSAPAKHCAIASEADRMIHAWTGHAVAEVPRGAFWQRRLAHGFRFWEIAP